MTRTTVLIYNWGIKDVDYHITKIEKIGNTRKEVWRCPYYTDWKGILQRCYNPITHKTHPNYKGCTICEDWRYLSNFIKWVDSQPNRDWMNCSLDKDFLVEGNKHYSPDTCVYIPSSLNSFITTRSNSRGIHMIGARSVRRGEENYIQQ